MGKFRLKLKELTLLGRMNDVNIQLKLEVDYDEGVSMIDVVKQITEKFHTAGLEPPVQGAKQSYRTIAEQHGATGTHPDDLIPKISRGGDHEKCPNCQKPLYVVTGITKKKDSPKFGQPWSKWFCPKARGGCGAYNFDDRKDARFD